MLSRILVPLDGSPLAEAVLCQVVEIATLKKSEIVLLRAALAHAILGAEQVEAQVRVVEEAQAYLAKIETNLAAQGFAVKSVVRYGHAADEILDHARAGGVGLIAMSTHGRGGVRRWVLGSVAETVVRHAPVPVLLVRATAPVIASREA
jgi:nucleotide-binding universal stress UspA family protein